MTDLQKNCLPAKHPLNTAMHPKSHRLLLRPAVTDEPPRDLVGDFHVTDSRAGYWYVRCRLCKAAWHLPQEPSRRAAEAMALLREHADAHR